jgi:hypothetical protein
MVLAILALSATNTNAASAYDAILYCEGQSTNWMTGTPVTAKIAIVPAERTDRSLWAGDLDDTEPLANGVGLGLVEWDDGVLGVRRDRAVQLTQPTNDSTLYDPIDMPLVILGFRASPTGSIPLVVRVEVHKRGIPFRAWRPGREELLTGGCKKLQESAAYTID